MATPVPKPRTKFGPTDCINPNEILQNRSNQNIALEPPPLSPSPPETPTKGLQRCAEEVQVILPQSANTSKLAPSKSTLPVVPPRPPTKPPRLMPIQNNLEVEESVRNATENLKIHTGKPYASKPSEYELIANSGAVNHPGESDMQMSPPLRHAPPPPSSPPPHRWKTEIQKPPIIPIIPEKGASYSNRPLPALPMYAELIPSNSVPSTSSPLSSATWNSHENPNYVENPLYLSLEAYRSMSRSTPLPSNPPTTFPDYDELKEWLTEEEDDTCNSYAPANLDSNLPTSQQHSRSSLGHQQQENPYTPCPRRSDYSSSELVSPILDPFDHSFFTSISSPNRSSLSSQHQNLYVSPQFGKNTTKFGDSDEYDNVVEACATTSSFPLNAHYVNLPPNDLAIEIEDQFRDNRTDNNGKLKIEGNSITFVGFVCLTSTKKEKRLHCRLRNMQLSFHDDEESIIACLGPYDIKDIYMFRQFSSSDTSSPSTSSGAVITSSILIHAGEKRTVISFIPEDPPNLWMFFLSEAWLSLNYGLTTALRDADELAICGMTWIKHGATGEWKRCSAGINNLTLYYISADSKDGMLKRNNENIESGSSIEYNISTSIGEELVEVDLRKVMAMRDRIDKSEYCPNVKHKRGPFSITMHGLTLYIDTRDESTTSHWYDATDSLLKKPATRLENHRLTGDNIPVIVDKCIRFVSAYGMKSEGIYRRNGKVAEAKTILAKLTEDPVGFYPVQENDETVYAVADVLRQFFRRLDESLFPFSAQADLLELALESQSEDLYRRYAEIIEQFPTVNYATLKKVIGHLKNISEHVQENRASVENLAKVFAASLFSAVTKVFCENYQNQINTMIHLITGYDCIFQISIEEALSRQMVNDAAKKSFNAKKPSPDFIVPIHVWEKENRPFNVKLSLASEEVCREAVAKRGFDGPPGSSYAVFECLANGCLVRRLPCAQKMSRCVLQWIDWNCKDGYLLFDHDKYRFDGTEMSCFTGKVKIAEPGSRTFKSYEVKIENGTSIVAFRNEKITKSWPMEDVIWYVGAEPSRRCPNSFNTTMISLSKEGYAGRFPGFCFSFKDEAERTRWLTAVTHFTGGDSEPLVYI